MFDSTKEDLKDILKKVDEGKLQLPDFQRDYVWGEDDVKSLIASIAKGFPVGALLTLETGGEVHFKPRVLSGAPDRGQDPEELLLDGQQRITSLYQALHADSPMKTKTAKGVQVERYFFINIEKAVANAADIEDAIVGVPADRVLRRDFGREVVLDLSERTAQFEQNLFPLNQVFDRDDWIYDWRDHARAQNRDIDELERPFVRGVIDAIERYKMPIIRLDKRNSREAICLVFEKVNVGGKKLDAFELVTAVYAGEGFDLRHDWLGPTGRPEEGRRGRLHGGATPRRVLKHIGSVDFLQACTVLHTRGRRLEAEAQGKQGADLPYVTCKRDALLALPLVAYKQHADDVEEGFIQAAQFLNELKIVLDPDVPYPPQLVALSGMFSVLGDRAHNAAIREKLRKWFWCVALGEQYGSSTESKIARDIQEMAGWILDEGDLPRSIDEAIFQQDRLYTLRSRKSAAYKAISALLMTRGCQDFISGQGFELMTFHEAKVDIHHIFPQAWCKKQGIDRKRYDAIVNKAPLSAKSNRIIGGRAPSVYLKTIESAHGLTTDQLDAILRTHLIEPELLRNDDFEGFMASRTEALTGLIEQALGKPVVRSQGHDEPELDIDDDEDLMEAYESDAAREDLQVS
ncbi:MAG: DUF262 domain-containing protein [Phycisphaeraceae bacterium]